jgi:serine/threonine protein kinase
MAPEVFRGDQNYTKKVDVFSFRIVLWELATRKTPWKEDIEDSARSAWRVHCRGDAALFS